MISADLDRLGQLRPGDLIRFHRVTLDPVAGWDLHPLKTNTSFTAHCVPVSGPDDGKGSSRGFLAIDSNLDRNYRHWP
jgi:hypothetical protein